MNTAEVLKILADNEILISAEEGLLRVKAPRGRLTPDLRSLIQDHKEAVITMLERRQQGRARMTQLPPERAAREGELPLAYVQQRLWFLYHLEGGSATYNMPSAFRLVGHLDKAAFNSCFAEIVSRHEILRTTFPQGEAGPYQKIDAAFQLQIGFESLENLSPDEREQTIQRLASEEGKTPFDLTNGPLLRVSLFRLTDQEHVVFINMHHIISDGWSRGRLVDEFVSLYSAHLLGRPSPLTDLPLQYADFAVWQRHWFEGQEVTRQSDYWRKQLGDLPPLLEMPTDFPRPAAQRYRGGAAKATMPKSLGNDLNALARESQSSLFMVTLAAFQTVLAKYARRSDIPVGTPIATRYRKEFESLIGFFVNTLVMRGDIQGEDTFLQLLEKTRKITLAAYDHQDLPFDQIVEELHPKRSTSYQPIFQVLFQVRNMPAGDLELPNLRLSSIAGEHTGSKFDLNLSVTEETAGLYLVLEYNSDLFLPETAARLIDHYRCLLTHAVAKPGTKVRDLPLMGEEEKAAVVAACHGSRLVFPEHFLRDRVTLTAQRHPNVTAAVYGEERLSYAQLDGAANRLAHYLTERGAVPGRTVGICIPRSMDLLVSVLAVAKTGATIVPLDPGYPPERLAAIMEGARPTLLMTLADGDLATSGTALVALAACRDEVAAKPATAFAARLSPDDPFYIIYTSGSTGTPKGVALHQGALANLMSWHREKLPLAPATPVTQFASINFDVSFQEIFSTWAEGGTLVHVPDAVRLDARLFMDLMEKEKVVRAYLPVAVLQQMAQEHAGTCRRLADLEDIITAGEALHVTEVVRQFFEAMPHTKLHNHYGPSESHVVTAFTCSGQVRRWSAFPSIGFPISNTSIYLVDSWLGLVPDGLYGELLIGGAQVGKGYHGQPVWTAERFIPDPFSLKPGSRLYRTGDLARRLPGGALDFAGRIDQQVQIRGFRVELGELETVLCQHPDVGEAAAMVREDQPGQKVLVAYLVPAQGLLPHIQELRLHLQSKLPDYMVPSAFVVLGHLPLNPSGKLDRKALPAPERADQEGFVAPRNPIEEEIASIWCEVLKIKRVGIHDNFFDIGGHSLLGTQVTSRILKVFGLDLPVVTLFDNPTLFQLAAHVQQERLHGRQLTVPALAPEQREDRIPLSFAQQRLWFLEQLETLGSTYHISAAVSFSGPLNLGLVHEALRRIVARHESLRTIFPDRDGTPVQVVLPELDLPLPVTDLSGLPDQSAAAKALARRAANAVFDLSTGPLLRHSVLKLADDEHILLVNMHHIVSDGWSQSLLIREFENLYARATTLPFELPPPPLPELKVQYPDFAIWQRRWLQGDTLAQYLDFWRNHLGGDLPRLNLPTDHIRPKKLSFRGLTEHIGLGPDLSERVREVGRRHSATDFMTLLTAYKILLYHYAGQTDIVVGIPIANRNRAETEPLIGFFVNTLALRSDLAPQGTVITFNALLEQVRDNTLNAYTYQDLPFEKLVEEIQPERDLSRTPIFQVMFSFQNLGAQRLNLPGLKVAPFGERREAAKFDLNMTIQETSEGLAASLNYSTDLFETATSRRLVAHYKKIVAEMVAAPDRRIDDLNLLTDEERTTLLETWNRTDMEGSEPANIQALFEEVARRTPEKTAVRCDEESLSYGVLNQRANFWAASLQDQGIGPESLVGISLDRSVEMVVALLGVLKAGAAYVPIDPRLPDSRMTQILQQSGLGTVLARPAHTDRPALRKVWAWHIDDSANGGTLANPPVRATAANLAYVVYTSGSTGEPKGVAVTHGNLSNYLNAIRQRLQLDEGDSFAMASTFYADLGNTAIFPALCGGGTLHLIGEDRMTDPHGFGQVMQQYDIDNLKITPSHLEALLNREEPAAVLPGKRLILGGEATPADLVGRVRALAPTLTIFNHYGPTETTVGVIAYKAPQTAMDLKLGTPLGNTRVYLVNQRLDPVPVGLSGEIVISGANVTRGYLGRPGETAARFVPNPFTPTPGDRLYRTGDQAHHLADGTLVFRGRSDSQVKLRGYRLELGEVAAVLETHARVNRALVLLRESAAGLHLMAYLQVAAVAGESPEERDRALIPEIRSLAEERLPAYMVPSGLVLLEQFPLNPNGKINRKALPEPEFRSAGTDISGLPRSPIEEILCDIFAAVLDLPRVGLHDNFFDMGGHSLLATRIISRVRAALNVEMTLRILFDAPTVARLAGQLEKSRKRQHRIELPPLTTVPRDGHLPLSFAQQRLWFLAQFQPGSSFYNMPRALRFRGQLDVTVLRRCLADIVARHEILRTTFKTVAGEATQVIGEDVSIDLVEEDVSTRGNPEDEMARRRLAHARQPFNLETGPLLAVTLVKMAERDHVLLINMHHIVSDGWSTSIFVRDLHALYCAYLEQKPNPLPKQYIQYADYSAWQRSWLQGSILETQLAFWKDRLGMNPQPLALPTDRPRRTGLSYHGDTLPFSIDPAVGEALADLGRRRGVTLFVSLLTVFKVLLYRYSGQRQVIVGTPIANRNHMEIEPLIGFFVNTLALRTDLTGNPRFETLLEQVRTTTLDAHAHQDLPFEKLVEELQTERDGNYSPLFQVMFVLQNTPARRLDLPGLTVETLGSFSETAKFDITLSIGEGENGIVAAFNYNTDLFDRETIQGMIGHYQVLLTQLVGHPELRVGDVDLLTDTERHRLLTVWNRTAFDYDAKILAPDLFRAQAARSRNRLALAVQTAEGDLETITYGALDERSERLANHLSDLGAGPEVVIGILMERSLAQAVAVLAAMKAGSGYVPMDPSFPAARNAQVVQDANLPLLLVAGAAKPDGYEGTSVTLDADGLPVGDASQGEQRVKPALDGNHPSYIIYTSGSTGRPKGAVVTQGALIDLIHWHQHHFPVTGRTRATLLTSPAFDAAAWDFWANLCLGASLYVPNRETLLSPEALLTWMAVEGITRSFCPTPLAESLLAASWPDDLVLEYLYAGGDRLFRRPKPAFDTALINIYGPTECTVVSTFCNVPAVEDRSVPTVGRPVDNAVLYVVDEALRPVPTGVPGELLIGGPGLARGYLGQADLTAGSFIPNPFAGKHEPGSRLYRSGDLLRYLPNGELDFLARLDYQVKIRGFRIELGEIEAHLLAHEKVREAVVLAMAPTGQELTVEKRLAAWVVSDDPDLAAILPSFLAARLPEYMVPSGYLVMNAFPLTPTGKINRRALPPPRFGATGDAYAAPETSTEKTIAAVWQDVLHLPQVSRTDNFFSLGGHSLTATRVITGLRDVFPWDIPLRALFENPTLAGFARRIEDLGGAARSGEEREEGEI